MSVSTFTGFVFPFMLGAQFTVHAKGEPRLARDRDEVTGSRGLDFVEHVERCVGAGLGRSPGAVTPPSWRSDRPGCDGIV